MTTSQGFKREYLKSKCKLWPQKIFQLSKTIRKVKYKYTTESGSVH